MIASARLLRALLVLDLFAFLCALSLVTITSTGPAERALGRSVAILTEVDTYLDQHFAAIQAQAAQSQGQQLTLPNFPVGVSFTSAEIQQADREQFRELLLRRAGAVLHTEGTSAFRQQEGSSARSASPGGTIRAAMEILRPAPHRFFLALSIALGLIAGLISFTLLRSMPGFLAVRALGVMMSLTSASFFAAVILAWATLRLATLSTNDYVTNRFLLLAGQLAWAPLRDGLIIMVGAATFAAAGSLLGPASAARYA